MKKLVQRLNDPVIQAILVFSIFILFELISLIVSALSKSFDTTNYWILAGTFLMLYAIFNAIGMSQSRKTLWYWSRSMYGYFGLLVAVSLIAFAFSGVGINQAASIKWIFFIITMCYVLFLVISFLMRKIVDYAQKQDTHHRFKDH